MGIISEALKKAGQERRDAGAEGRPAGPGVPIVEVPSFGGLLNTSPEEGHTGEDRARMILKAMPGLDQRAMTVHQSTGVEAEHFRALRTRLLNQNPDNEHRVIGITSSVPREGKSVTTLNLVLAMSEVKHLRLLIVDGDFRRGCIAEMLNVAPKYGLADVIRGGVSLDEALFRTGVPNLCLLSSGNVGDGNAAEILSSTKALHVFDELRKRFHYVLVDTPPVITVADVGVIGQNCYGVILVVRMHLTHEHMAKRAVKQLQANNVNLLGCVILGRTDESGSFGYYEHYYRYYK